MREYHITFTCNHQDCHFGLSIVPDTENALRLLILSQIVDIKKSNGVEDFATTNLRVNYSDDGRRWHPYVFSI